MTADYCNSHRCHTCHCPRTRYSDPRTGGTVRVMPSLPPVPTH
jgi:hypothetical protein